MLIEVKDDGTGRFIALPVDTTHKALRTSLRPIEHDTGGFYRVGGASGALTGAGANTPVFSLRWTSATLNAIILAFQWWWFLSTAFGAAQIVDHGLYVARGFSASDSGGTDIKPTGNTGKKRTVYPTTAIGDLRIASAGALTVGTRTLDGQNIGARGQWAGAVGAALSPGIASFNFRLDDEHPVVLAQNEGLILQNLTAMGATGVIKLYVDVAWLEVPLAKF
jgi:hypothetical protein